MKLEKIVNSVRIIIAGELTTVLAQVREDFESSERGYDWDSYYSARKEIFDVFYHLCFGLTMLYKLDILGYHELDELWKFCEEFRIKTHGKFRVFIQERRPDVIAHDDFLNSD